MKTTYSSLVPMTWSCWKEGYTKETFLHDLKAGISVGLIAIPLAMAFAIGSGVDPEKGLFTTIIAGFLISLLGGSRVQIGGPTGAFVVIVYGIVQRHGYEGLALATLMAGGMILLMGLLRFGFLLKYIPHPVIVGFTTGIAVTILSTQVKDFFGLCITEVPGPFLAKWSSYIENALTCSPWATSLAFGTLALIFFIRSKRPLWPTVILAVMAATVIAKLCGMPVETVQSHFGGIPRTLPSPEIPLFSMEQMQILLPDAITIALLGAIESLLSAVVADKMTRQQHQPNCELVAQGLANIGSVLFGGIPATGAIARTSANIKLGAKTPMSGMIHAVTVLLVMLLMAPLAALAPLPALAAVLVFVAWNMSELPHFAAIFRSSRSDALVLVTTFLLTVLIDLTVAVAVGVTLSGALFYSKKFILQRT